jgi:NAD(P)-dependent dehydrogenase (short-subunit alcohol dehydrogenase family)
MTRFEGRTAVVTGAASGMGWHIAAQLQAEGAAVFAADMSDTVPEGCTAVPTDVSSEEQVAALIAAAVDATGRVDVLCNNAGIGSTKNPVDCTVEEWDRVFAVNVRGVFLGIKYAVPHMLRQKAGAIVNTASAGGLIGLKDRAAYCASKGAVIAFTKQVAIQYAGTGIRCNSVCPGTVDSPWVGRLMAEAEDPAQRRRDLIARQPLGRLGTPEEVARAVLYLASDDAAFVTGTDLIIDGGITAG